MNFDLNEDEEMLKALAERFVEDRYDFERRRAYVASELGFSPENWALLGELGMIAAPFSADHGGLGLDATALATVFESLGHGLVLEPLIENVLVAAQVFAHAAGADLAEQWLPGLIVGSRRLALAHAEAGGRGGRLWVEARAESDGAGGVRLTGTKPLVAAGAGVDGYIVSARTAGAPGSRDAIGLYLVEAGAPGLSVSPWRMADGLVAASLTLDQVPVPAGSVLTGGMDVLDAVEDIASLARSAEALGIMQRLFNDTLDYLRTRQQFGATLSSFQAIQHRMTAQYAVLEQARALLNLAMVSQGEPGFAQAVRGVRAFISGASVELGHEMIQFHGGMGVTDELAIGHGHKRLLVLSRWPEDPDAALDRFAGIAA